jgi:hypothetical protein
MSFLNLPQTILNKKCFYCTTIDVCEFTDSEEEMTYSEEQEETVHIEIKLPKNSTIRPISEKRDLKTDLRRSKYHNFKK